MTTTVLLAGSTGMLGNRIAAHLLDQPDVAVRLLLRDTARANPHKAQAIEALVARGATVAAGDVTDPTSLNAATGGVDVVISALQGGPEIIVDGQVALADAAARNGVRRFLPSDFAIDLFNAPEGAPQFAMRRRADSAIDALPMQVVHVLNGAFMDLMLDPSTAAIVDLNQATAMLWGTGDEPFNLTTVEDTARFTAKIATDPAELSGVHYVSGAETTFNHIIAETEAITGKTLTRTVMGSAADLRRITADAEDPWRSSRSGTSCRCSRCRRSRPPTTTATPTPTPPACTTTSSAPTAPSRQPDRHWQEPDGAATSSSTTAERPPPDITRRILRAGADRQCRRPDGGRR